MCRNQMFAVSSSLVAIHNMTATFLVGSDQIALINAKHNGNGEPKAR